MKKFLISALVLLLVVFPFSASAHSQRVVDNAALLTADQITELTSIAQDIADTYQMDLIIVTVDSLNGETPQDFADDYYDSNGYGFGNDHSGTVLLLSMEYRDWAISTCGEAIYALTDSSIDSVAEDFLPWLAQGNYYTGFRVFLSSVEAYYQVYRGSDSPNKDPGYYDEPDFEQDITQESEDPGFCARLLIGLVAGVAVAGITILIMRSNMNTAKQQSDAGSYMKENTFDLFRCHDMFLYSRTTKTRRSSDSGGSRGGGSSVHRSSSGRSHGGRSGKF